MNRQPQEPAPPSAQEILDQTPRRTSKTGLGCATVLVLAAIFGGFLGYSFLRDREDGSGDFSAPPVIPAPNIDAESDDPSDPETAAQTETGAAVVGDVAEADKNAEEEAQQSNETTTTSIVAVPDELVGTWIQTELIRTVTEEVITPTDPLVLEFEDDGTFTQRLESVSEADEQLFRLVAEDDGTRLLVYDSPEALDAQQHSLGPMIEIDDDVLTLEFGEESTLVFERDLN